MFLNKVHRAWSPRLPGKAEVYRPDIVRHPGLCTSQRRSVLRRRSYDVIRHKGTLCAVGVSTFAGMRWFNSQECVGQP